MTLRPLRGRQAQLASQEAQKLRLQSRHTPKQPQRQPQKARIDRVGGFPRQHQKNTVLIDLTPAQSNGRRCKAELACRNDPGGRFGSVQGMSLSELHEPMMVALKNVAVQKSQNNWRMPTGWPLHRQNQVKAMCTTEVMKRLTALHPRNSNPLTWREIPPQVPHHWV